MNLNDYLKILIDKRNLRQEEAEGLADILLEENIDETIASAVLTALKMKGETSDEIVGFARSLRKHSLKINYDNAIDIVGTGGDGLNTLNVSTVVSILLSKYNPVAKHGNKAFSSKSGSADFLETIGYNININPDRAKELIEKYNYVFLFAQLYHKSMKNIAPIRKKLGIRTIFNIIGPLTNPANVKRQIIGVYPESYLDIIANAVKELKYDKIILVTGYPGIDEVSPIGKTKIIEIKQEKEEKYEISPEDFNLKPVKISDIVVNNPEESAIKVLRASMGLDKSSETFIAINAALGLYLLGIKDIKDGYELSIELLRNLKERLKEIVSSNGDINKLNKLMAMING
ncbi:anthranilate phosphoribosyltransferase [Caldisphaera sp.]|uniref:anthranilate phosphoribosyltransferase n=1 Tax=Caldisphaera sp. TaxID=2060322 RepID=UPI003D10323B